MSAVGTPLKAGTGIVVTYTTKLAVAPNADPQNRKGEQAAAEQAATITGAAAAVNVVAKPGGGFMVTE
jgi:hypothetical protein